MKSTLRISLLIALSAAALATAADAARVRVVHRGPRAHVHVRTGFPIVRPLPRVYVRPARVAVRVAPVTYLPPVAFGATVVAAPRSDVQVWHAGERLDADDAWTDFTLNVDRRGDRLLLDIQDGPAQISFAEVVFDNGEAQVVDFADGVHPPGVYSLLDFRDGRKVDHVRVVAKAEGKRSEISLRLVT